MCICGPPLVLNVFVLSSLATTEIQLSFLISLEHNIMCRFHARLQLVMAVVQKEKGLLLIWTTSLILGKPMGTGPAGGRSRILAREARGDGPSRIEEPRRQDLDSHRNRGQLPPHRQGSVGPIGPSTPGGRTQILIAVEAAQEGQARQHIKHSRR